MRCIKVFVVFVIVLCGVGLLSAQAQSARNMGTFGVFSDEYDWYMDITDWYRAVPKRAAGYVGVTSSVYNVGGAGKIGNVYMAGAYTGLITAYGYRDDTMTDENFALMAAFGDIWSIKFTYFDQNYPGGVGTAAPALYLGMSLPVSTDSRFKASAGVYGAMRFSGGWIMDLLQTAISTTVEYELNPDWSFGLSYTVMPTFAGLKNSTNVAAIPVLHQIGGWYRQSWNIGEQLSIGLKFSIVSNLNPNRLVGAYDLAIGLPISVVYQAIPSKFDLVAGIKIGYYYANFDYNNFITGVGGNKKGNVPSTGISLGCAIHMTTHATLQIAAQFERVPFYSFGSPYNVSAREITLASFFEGPLAVTLRVSF